MGPLPPPPLPQSQGCCGSARRCVIRYSRPVRLRSPRRQGNIDAGGSWGKRMLSLSTETGNSLIRPFPVFSRQAPRHAHCRCRLRAPRLCLAYLGSPRPTCALHSFHVHPLTLQVWPRARRSMQFHIDVILVRTLQVGTCSSSMCLLVASPFMCARWGRCRRKNAA